MLGFRRFVVGAQIGLSLLLLVGAGLFVRTMHELRNFDVGFKTDHLVGFGLAPRLAGYNSTSIPAMRTRMLESVGGIAGVESAAATNTPQLGRSSHSGSLVFAGYKPGPDEDVNIDKTNISPGYLETFQIPLIAGRAFSQDDSANHPKVAIVNEALAKRYFGSVANALGQMVGDTGPKPVFDTQIVGVVANYHQADIRGETSPTILMPLEQATGNDVSRALYFYVRTHIPPETMFASIRRSVANVDPLLAIDDMRTMDEQIDQDLKNERLIELLAITFGVLATVLAGVGLYGVVAYTTGQRTKEIGIRMALGSSRWLIGKLVFSDVLKLASSGIVVGLPLAMMLARLLRSQLFGVTPADPYVLVSAVGLIALVALIAALLPARKAASVEPSEVLRAE
jgi:predicted permease